MKKSVFKQSWKVHGRNGLLHGTIVVTMNHDTKPISGTHAGTHDDYNKIINIHKVEGFINDKLLRGSYELKTESEVLAESEACKKQMQEEMERLANSAPSKSFADRMADLGFDK